MQVTKIVDAALLVLVIGGGLALVLSRLVSEQFCLISLFLISALTAIIVDMCKEKLLEIAINTALVVITLLFILHPNKIIGQTAAILLTVVFLSFLVHSIGTEVKEGSFHWKSAAIPCMVEAGVLAIWIEVCLRLLKGS